MNKLMTVSLKETSVLRTLLVVLTLLLGLTVSALPAAAAPSVPIETVHFVGGRLVQTSGQANLWTEYDFNGTKRYTFETKSYDKNTLRLKGQILKNQSGHVELLIDFRARTVSGEWPGRAMAKLYDITKVDYFVAKTPVSKPPVVQAPISKAPASKAPVSQTPISRDERGNAVETVPAPNYIPPGKKQPLPTPSPVAPPPVTPSPVKTPPVSPPAPVVPTPVAPAPIAPAPVLIVPTPVVPTPTTPAPVAPAPISAPKALTPSTLRRAAYDGGYFVKNEDKSWVETTPEDNTYSYQPVGYDDHAVFLYDMDRKVLVEMNIDTSKSRISRAGGVLKAYVPLIELSDSSAAPTPPIETLAGGNEPSGPVLPTKLSAVERAICLSKKGVIEQAGLLGAERCTMSYSDGGNICIDSSNCQGKCLTSVNAKDQKTTSGQCQKTDNPFGCYSEVLGGKVQPGLCVD